MTLLASKQQYQLTLPECTVHCILLNVDLVWAGGQGFIFLIALQQATLSNSIVV